MQPIAISFALTSKRLKAVALVDQDVLSNAEISNHLKINKTTLERQAHDISGFGRLPRSAESRPFQDERDQKAADQ
jgi:hypothetical protein